MSQGYGECRITAKAMVTSNQDGTFTILSRSPLIENRTVTRDELLEMGPVSPVNDDARSFLSSIDPGLCKPKRGQAATPSESPRAVDTEDDLDEEAA